MISQIKDICSNCGKPRFIQNKKKHLCSECVSILNRTNKIYVLKKTPLKKKPRKVTGERDLFLEIWEEREHKCANCKCPLGDEPKAFMFAHKKAKGADGTKRLLKSNIELNCYECHNARDFVGNEALKKRYRDE